MNRISKYLNQVHNYNNKHKDTTNNKHFITFINFINFIHFFIFYKLRKMMKSVKVMNFLFEVFSWCFNVCCLFVLVLLVVTAVHHF